MERVRRIAGQRQGYGNQRQDAEDQGRHGGLPEAGPDGQVAAGGRFGGVQNGHGHADDRIGQRGQEAEEHIAHGAAARLAVQGGARGRHEEKGRQDEETNRSLRGMYGAEGDSVGRPERRPGNRYASSPFSAASWHSTQWGDQGIAVRRFSLIGAPQFWQKP